MTDTEKLNTLVDSVREALATASTHQEVCTMMIDVVKVLTDGLKKAEISQ